MKYKPTYGDKQREAARRKKNERQQIRQTEPDTAKQEVAGQPKGGEKRSEREDKSAA